MKRKYWQHHLIGALLAFLLSISTVGMLVTGWDLTLLSAKGAIVWCGLFSVLPCMLFYFRYGWCAFLLLSVRAAYILWEDGALLEQIQSFAYTVSMHYHNVYGWQTIGSPVTADVSLVLLSAAYLTALSVSICICCRCHSILALPPVLLPLVLCLVTTDTLPDEPYLFLLILGIVLLLVTDLVRRTDPERFASLTLRTSIPAAAALALLFSLNPQETYVNRAAALEQNVINGYRQMQSAAETVLSKNITGSFAFQTLDLRHVGPKSDFSYTVMHVTSSYDGVVYLRGRDYDTYTGTAWESSDSRQELFPAGTDVLGELMISTSGTKNVKYLPYYSIEEEILTDGFAENKDKTKEYRFSVAKNPGRIHSGGSGYTDLPPETSAWAVPLVEKIFREQPGVRSKIRCITDYVRTSAAYDRTTPAMDSGNKDFAEWFLRHSDTGYCVHFATAAAVLLRAAGIPARYVEGYMIPCRADEPITITNQEAHAWVEYYDSGSGVWQILDATPSSGTAAEEAVPDETDPSEDTADETDVSSPEEPDPSEQPAPESTETAEPSSGNSETTDAPDTPASSPGIAGGISSGTGEGDSPREPFRIPDWIKKLTWIVLVLAVLPVQGELRIAVNRKKRQTGSPNEMALIRWKQSVVLAQRTGIRLPAELDALAQKARFSQHTITPQELAAFSRFRRQVLDSVCRMPWYRRIVLRWVFAVG